MSVTDTQDLIERYFVAMGADEDFSAFYDESVTWLMVDSGQQVSGPSAVRDYLLELHGKMTSGDQREMVFTDGHAYLEGSSINAGEEHGGGLSYCLVYDVRGERIVAARCYGTLARLMSIED